MITISDGDRNQKVSCMLCCLYSLYAIGRIAKEGKIVERLKLKSIIITKHSLYKQATYLKDLK